MTEVVINDCYGGFSISPKAAERLAELKGLELYWFEPKDRTQFAFQRDVEMVQVSTPERAIFGPSAYTSPNREDDTYFSLHWDGQRDDPDLVQVIKELGDEANGSLASLKIVEIPDDVEWHIEEYDGNEWVAENHRKWY